MWVGTLHAVVLLYALVSMSGFGNKEEGGMLSLGVYCCARIFFHCNILTPNFIFYYLAENKKPHNSLIFI